MSTPDDMEKEDYVIDTGSVFADMRVLVEGAVCLYSEHTSTMFSLSYRHDGGMSATVLNAIGSALYELRGHVCALQAAYAEEVCRQMAKEAGGQP